ncbi:MAG: YtxH domain-containing protein, partial [Elusimicrobia bacterium]|nr:YtxH domain-containing protein [Elusimicrobiota bacterium]
MKQQEESTAGGGSSLAYLFGGFALGTVCGLLFAPKPGKELREDINEWGRHNRERGRELVARVKEYIPHKVKNAVN